MTLKVNNIPDWTQADMDKAQARYQAAFGENLFPVGSTIDDLPLSSDWNQIQTELNARVPYTGATADVDLGANDLLAAKGSFKPVISIPTIDITTNYVLNGAPFVAGLTDWTSAGWTYSAVNGGSALHSTGNTNKLSQTVSVPSGGYRLQYTLGSGTSGTFRCYVNGVSLSSSSSAGTKTMYFSSGGGGDLIEFEPSSTQTRPVYNVTVNKISASDPAIEFKDTTGTSFEARGYRATSSFAFGKNSLSSNITGSYNIAIGDDVMPNNVSGGYNVGIGIGTLDRSNTSFNAAIGFYALHSLTTGIQNFALGYQSGLSLSTGNYNTMTGVLCGYTLSTGSSNAFYGYNAARICTTGGNNVAIGANSAGGLTTGSSNILIGLGAGVSTQSYCITLGASSTFLARDYSMCVGQYINGLNGDDHPSAATGFGMVAEANSRISAKAVEATFTNSKNITASDADSRDLTGIGTLFTIELAVGDAVSVYNTSEAALYYTTIAAIADNTHLTLTDAVGGGGGFNFTVYVRVLNDILRGYDTADAEVVSINKDGELIATTMKPTAAGGYKSSDGSAGLTATITTAKLTTIGTNGSMTFKDGILTAQTQAT